MGDGASEPIIVEGVVLDDEDLKEPAPEWPSLRRLDGFTQMAAIGGPILAMLIAVSTATSIDHGVAAFSILAGSWIVVRVIWRRREKRARELAALSPIYRGACDWTIGEAGMRQSSQPITSELPWSSIVEAVESAKSFTFVLSPYVSTRLPKRCCDARTLDRLRELILQARERGDIRDFPTAGAEAAGQSADLPSRASHRSPAALTASSVPTAPAAAWALASAWAVFRRDFLEDGVRPAARSASAQAP